MINKYLIKQKVILKIEWYVFIFSWYVYTYFWAFFMRYIILTLNRGLSLVKKWIFFIFFEKVENEYDKNRAGEMFLGAFLSC